MLKTVIAVLFCLPIAFALECYVCTNQEDNEDKCIKTIKTCNIDENRCFSEVRWGSTPYWDATGRKQYFISKTCATEDRCKRDIETVTPRCDRIGYNDWECVECCHGDRCNYYVTLDGAIVSPNKLFYILLTLAWFVVVKFI